MSAPLSTAVLELYAGDLPGQMDVANELLTALQQSEVNAEDLRVRQDGRGAGRGLELRRRRLDRSARGADPVTGSVHLQTLDGLAEMIRQAPPAGRLVAALDLVGLLLIGIDRHLTSLLRGAR